MINPAISALSGFFRGAIEHFNSDVCYLKEIS